MKLSDAEIRPGFVTQIVDSQGTIKAAVVGLFDEDDQDLVPPITPFGTFSRGTFSAPEIGDPIWVLYFKNNPQFLRYIRQCNLNEDLNDILKKDSKNCEVLMRRDKGLDHAQLYFNDEDGWIIQSNLSTIRICGDDSIQMSLGEPNRTIEINSAGISIGSPGSSKEPAVLGDSLTDVMNELVLMIKMVKQAASASPYTKAIATAIESKLPSIEGKIPLICSNNITID